MKPHVTLAIASLLSIALVVLHLTDDIVRGIDAGGVSTYYAVIVLAVWLYGTLVLVERRSGHIIILLASIPGAGIPVIHMMGNGLTGGRIAGSSGMFFWVWTLLALGVTACFSIILAVHGLWSMRRKQSR
jgi:hypothetical protein